MIITKIIDHILGESISLISFLHIVCFITALECDE